MSPTPERIRLRFTLKALLPTLLLLAVAACGPPEDARPAGDYGAWAEDDPARWPRIALVNRIRYSDSSHPLAGSAFLLETDDRLVAVTAKHVLRFFKSEAMDSVSFGGTLVSWEMSPKDEPADVTLVGSLINEDAGESLEEIRAATDWLLFTVERASESVTPLRLRTTPLKAGEPLFIVGWRYTDEGRQRVYRASYVRADRGTILIESDKLADNKIPGLSGAPVIDARGYVVGLMSSKSGRLERLAPADYAREVLERQR